VSHERSDSSEPLKVPIVDFSLWGEQRLRANRQTAGKQSGNPLAVLRIPKIHLEVTVFAVTDEITPNHALAASRARHASWKQATSALPALGTVSFED